MDEGDLEWSVSRDELESDGLEHGERNDSEWDSPGLIVGGNEQAAR